MCHSQKKSIRKNGWIQHITKLKYMFRIVTYTNSLIALPTSIQFMIYDFRRLRWKKRVRKKNVNEHYCGRMNMAHFWFNGSIKSIFWLFLMEMKRSFIYEFILSGCILKINWFDFVNINDFWFELLILKKSEKFFSPQKLFWCFWLIKMW